MIKKLFYILIPMSFIFALGLVGCAMSIRGSGDVVEEGREVREFDRIALDGVGEIILTQGDSTSLVVKAEDNLMAYIKTDVKGDELVINIKSRRPIVPSKPLQFYVTTPNIEAVSINGAGIVNSEKLDLATIEFRIDGSGQIIIDDLAADEVAVNINGLGDLDLSGSVKRQTIDIDGAGSYDGRRLESGTAIVSIDGLGSADLAVADSLDVSINGSGDVTYTGDPTINQSVDGLGNIRKR